MMMSSTSSCMDGYGNHFVMHQQQVSSTNFQTNTSQRYQNYDYQSTNEWSGVPLIKATTSDGRHKKVYNTSSNGFEFDESAMSRLAKHAHGAPIIMAGRYRSKSIKPMQPFGHENGNLKNYNHNGASNLRPDGEINNYDDSVSYLSSHTNGTCLPRIIKPRKRRKKDRKPTVGGVGQQSMENSPPSPFAFPAGQSTGFAQNYTGNAYQTNDNFKRPALPRKDQNIFFNSDFDPSHMLSSTPSSPISLSNSSLSSTTTSSCSCRLCDPNCKIWAFPLRRSFSDNSAVEFDHHHNNGSNSDCPHIETVRKDVGVIGGNRVKTEQNPSTETRTSFSFLDIMEFNHYHRQNSTNLAISDEDRLRSESLSDSSDSGCDLLLSGLIIADDILTPNIKKSVNDNLITDGLHSITQQLADFNIISSQSPSMLRSNDNEIDNEHILRMDTTSTFCYNSIVKSSSSGTCEFGSNNLVDKLLEMKMATPCDDNYGLVSPMLVNKHNFNNNNIDMNNNNNNHSSSAGMATTATDDEQINQNGLNEHNQMLFDCFDITMERILKK